MLYIILLLILAVLLFGAAAVLSAIGRVLSFIVAMIALTIALTWISIAFDVPPANLIAALMIGVLGFLALCGLIVLVAKGEADLQAKRKAEMQEAVAKIQAKHAAMSRVAEVNKIMTRDACSLADAVLTWRNAAQREAEMQEAVANVQARDKTTKHAAMSRAAEEQAEFPSRDIVAEVRKIMTDDGCSMADALRTWRSQGKTGS